MLMDYSIFNDARDITGRLEDLNESGNQQAAMDLEDDLNSVLRQISVREADPDDLKDTIKNDYDGDKEEAVDDLVGDTFDGTLRLMFVPRGSVLSEALMAYYGYVDKKNGNKYGENFNKETHHYARSAVMADNYTGFYYVTGIGYSTIDELFSGMPNAQVGTEKMPRKFIYYLNYIDRDNDKEAERESKNAQRVIKEDYGVKD